MKLFIAIAAAMTLGSAVSLAADAGATDSTAAASTGKRWAACATELQKFCADIEKGKGKKRACLEQHTADLSDGCKTSLAEHASKSGATPPAN